MKNLWITPRGCTGNYLSYASKLYAAFRRITLIGSAMVALGVLFTACKKTDIIAAASETEPAATKNALASDGEFNSSYSFINPSTLWELRQARAATAKYRNIESAIRDGYADISVVVENMGHHYMKSTLVNSSFEARKPEILVYNKLDDGTFELVAVEYAVPIELSPNEAPEGFTGTDDVWDRNTGFGLWLLHAWVWHFNPDGVFNPTNPLVHQH